MTYTIDLSEGTVTRNSDGQVVAPCQSSEDPDFMAYLDWVAAGNQPAETQDAGASIAALVASYTAAIQAHLDATAQARNYDGILSLASYVTSKNATFAAEGQAGVGFRDACWAYAYQLLADVEGGKRAMPTVAELLAELPVMVWP